MKYHKVGDQLLTDDEYDQYQDENWGFWLFVIGAIISGILSYFYVIPEVFPSSEIWAKMILIILPAIAGGIALSMLKNIIQDIIGCVSVLLIAYGVFIIINGVLPQ
jgi:hypothetical protein